MLKWNQLHQQLETVANRYSQLETKFQTFAKLVEEQVTHPTFHIKGITVSPNLEQSYFTTTFAGRTLYFTFSSALAENGTLVGTVTCGLMRELPEKTLVSVGEFTFTGSGKTNLHDPECVFH